MLSISTHCRVPYRLSVTSSSSSVVTHSDFNIKFSCNKQPWHPAYILNASSTEKCILLASREPFPCFPISFALSEVYYLQQPLTSFDIQSLEWVLTKTAPVNSCTNCSHVLLKSKVHVVWGLAKSFVFLQPRYAGSQSILPSCRYKIHGNSAFAMKSTPVKL